MDARVTALLDEIDGSQNIEPIAVRHRIAKLFGQVGDEESRVALLQTFHAVMGLAVRTLEREGRDTTALKNAILADRRGFAIEEAMIGENVDPPTLHRVIERKVAAGRMERDSFHELAEAGASVLGSGAPAPKKAGFLRRLFGTSGD